MIDPARREFLAATDGVGLVMLRRGVRADARERRAAPPVLAAGQTARLLDVSDPASWHDDGTRFHHFRNKEGFEADIVSATGSSPSHSAPCGRRPEGTGPYHPAVRVPQGAVAETTDLWSRRGLVPKPRLPDQPRQLMPDRPDWVRQGIAFGWDSSRRAEKRRWRWTTFSNRPNSSSSCRSVRSASAGSSWRWCCRSNSRRLRATAGRRSNPEANDSAAASGSARMRSSPLITDAGHSCEWLKTPGPAHSVGLPEHRVELVDRHVRVHATARSVTRCGPPRRTWRMPRRRTARLPTPGRRR